MLCTLSIPTLLPSAALISHTPTGPPHSKQSSLYSPTICSYKVTPSFSSTTLQNNTTLWGPVLPTLEPIGNISHSSQNPCLQGKILNTEGITKNGMRNRKDPLSCSPWISRIPTVKRTVLLKLLQIPQYREG